MSFSGNIKEEISRQLSPARHCQIAELAAIISMCGAVMIDSRGHAALKIHTENLAVARKSFTLLRRTFNIVVDIAIRVNREKGSSYYYIVVKKHEDAIRVLQAAKLLNPYGDVEEELSVVKNVVIQETCCIVSRKKSFVVYLKEGAQIVDVLNVMEAHQSLMELENIRILKDMRNTVNRKVNCETANINKTVSAAVKQIDDIRYIEETKGLDKLPEGLKDMALTRLTYPEASLKELGALLQNPVGKSGVNHRLRKLSEMAEEIRAKQGGTL